MKKILNLAHRGYSGKYPENTKIAFLKAIEHSDCDGFETDVHMTKDGKLVIIHDDMIDRTCSNGSGFVKDFTASELLKFEFGSHKGSEFMGERIIFLEELLQIVKDNNLFINLELKNNYIFYKGLEEAVMNTVNEFSLKDSVILSSFNHESMELCKKIDPTFKTGLLFESPLMDTVNYMKGIKHEAVHPGYYMLLQSPNWVLEFKKENLEINTWTVNDEQYIKYVAEMGVDAIIGNFPELTSKVLRSLKF